MDNTPNYANSPVEQKPSRKKTIWLVIIILALIASNTGWALFYLKQQGELTTKINTLTAQNLKLAKDNKDLQNADSNAEDTSEYREIPEVSVKYKVTDTTKDLTYTYDPVNDFISFATVELIKAGGENKENPGTNVCSSENGSGGRIVRVKAGENYTEASGDTPIEKVEGAKKIGNYYYVFAHVQNYCGEGNVMALAKSANDATKAAFDSLKAN